MKIYGIGGTNGSGKDTVGLMLAEDYGFFFVSATDLLRGELRHRKLPIERKNTAALSAEWRREFGFGALIDKAVEEFKKQPKEYKGLVIASLRHPAEADQVHNDGGEVIWVDADQRIRYDRVIKHAHLRNRSGEDDKTFEEFQADEQREMHPEGDAATLNMSAVKDRADISIDNNGDDLEAFKKMAKKALGF